MTPDQKAKLEQAAREWFSKHGFPPHDPDVAALVTLLAAQRAAVLEEANREVERIRGNGSVSDFGKGVVAACIDMQTWLYQQVQEQTP